MKLFDESEEAQIWTLRNQGAKTLNQNQRKENLKNFSLATLGPTKLLLGITLLLVIISIFFIFILLDEEKESWNLEFDDFSEEIINIKSDLTDTRSKPGKDLDLLGPTDGKKKSEFQDCSGLYNTMLISKKCQN